MSRPDEPGIKGKYAPLFVRLRSHKDDRWHVSFKEIEEVLGFSLPRSARVYQPWWANQSNPGSHSHAQAWQLAGWKARSVDLANESLVFERVSSGAPPIGKDSLSSNNPEFGAGRPNGRTEKSTADEAASGSKRGSAPTLFEQLARWVMSDLYEVPLNSGKIAGVNKTFDMASEDGAVVGDAKYFSMAAGEHLPPGEFSAIAEHVWLLEKTDARFRFLVFGSDQRVPEKWIDAYGVLAPTVAFYFLSDNGNLETLKEQVE